MEQILGLVLAVLISVGASWLDKWWKAHKHNQSHKAVRPVRHAAHTTPPVIPTRPTATPPVIMSPENEGGRITQLGPEPVETPIILEPSQLPVATEPASPELTEHYRRWRQAMIDSEVLAPRNF